jgi:hypothetical protein
MTEPSSAPEGSARPVVLLPWIVFALTLLSSFWLVARYGANIPRSDEWRDVSVLLGDDPLTFDWLIRPHSVHRIPAPRLVRLLLYRVSGRDFRSALVFNVAVMALATFLALRTVGRCRGATARWDALLPLLLLGPSHYANFLWGFQVQFALSAALFLASIAIVASCETRPDPAKLRFLTIVLALQALCGANGVALAAPLIPWSLAAASGQRKVPVVLALAAIPAVLVALYPIGLAARDPISASPADAARTALQFLSTGLAAAVPLWTLRSVFVGSLTAGAFALLFRAFRKIPSERWRSSGLAACGLSMLLLAAFVGLGRAELTVNAGIQDRYATLAAPLLLVVYLSFLLYGARSKRAVEKALFAAVALSVPVSSTQAIGYGEFRRAQIQALERDAARGLPLEAIAARNGPAVYQYAPGVPLYLSRLLKRRDWPFESYEPDPRIRPAVARRTDVPLASAALHDLRESEGGFVPTGPSPRILVQLTERRALAGVELRFSVSERSGRLLRLELRWASAGDEFPLGTHLAGFPLQAEPGAQTVRASIFDDVAAVRIDLDRAAEKFVLHRLVLEELAPDWIPTDRRDAEAP